MLISTNTMGTLGLVSIQHELAMNICMAPELKPMVREFMKVCLRRLDISRTRMIVLTSPPEDSSLISDTASGHIHISMPEGGNRTSLHDLLEQSTFLFQNPEIDLHPKTIRKDNSFFYIYQINGIGFIAFERINTPLPEKLLQALIPIIERLGEACKATMQHEKILEEIVRRKEAEKRIEHFAYYDSLTGLPNRSNLLMNMTKHKPETGETGIWGMLLYVDLDNFKDINDSLGYFVGDMVVRKMADRIHSLVSENGLVARLGSDEFGVFIPVDDQSMESIKGHGTGLARAIQETIAKPCILDERPLVLSASIGIVILKDTHIPMDVLLGQGNQAMYQAKELGRYTIQFFDSRKNEDIENRLLLDSEMRAALRENQFTLFLQPQVDQRGQIIGAEALIRWLHPEKGLVSPASFIPMAEKSGFIVPISDWVLQQACEYINQLEKQNLFPPSFYIAVNLSAKYFHQADFVTRVAQIVKKMGTSPERIELEITENTLINNIDETVDKIYQLRKLGFQFSIDDFGTGYSSITYLKQLPIDRIKIDRSFVREVHKSPDDTAIVETILSMAKHFRLKVIAEGVESTAELEALVRQGCLQFQGYHFYHPLPFTTFNELMQLGKTQDNYITP